MKPIGLFDSGVGGLTLVREVQNQLPGRRIVYFGDTANVPYGEKSVDELIGLADSIVSFLVEKGVEAVVDGCNSTSAVALDFLVQHYEVPIVGVIQAGVRDAVKKTVSGRIGVIGTTATIASEAHARAARKIDSRVTIFGQACPKFVPLVEAGRVDGFETRLAAEEYLKPLQERRIDTLILGCTHYPFLVSVLKDILGPEVTLVDPAEGTIEELSGLLGTAAAPAPKTTYADHEYHVSGDPETFRQVGETLAAAALGTIKQTVLIKKNDMLVEG